MHVITETRSPVALVLCGGGSRGAMEVGFYRALHELGLHVDLIIGASIGALNGAFIAGGMPPNDLAELWRGFPRPDGIRWNFRCLLDPRGRPGLFTLDPLRDLLRRTLPVTRFEHLAVPFSIVTTDLQGGKAVYWGGGGDIVEPILASLSLPGLFPPVEIGRGQFVDGGIANNVPLDQAVAAGAHDILMIQCMCCEARTTSYKGFISILARSFLLALDCRYAADLAHFGGHVRIHVVRPHFPLEVGLLDFRHTLDLIDVGYQESLAHFKRHPVEESAAAGEHAPTQAPVVERLRSDSPCNDAL